MISGGNATVFVSDLDAAVRFYTEQLGLPLKERYENDWAAVEAGRGLVIGLHPLTTFSPPASLVGSVTVGLDVTEPLEGVIKTLSARGVHFDGPIVEDPHSPARLAFFFDQDGNRLYLIELQ